MYDSGGVIRVLNPQLSYEYANLSDLYKTDFSTNHILCEAIIGQLKSLKNPSYFFTETQG